MCIIQQGRKIDRKGTELFVVITNAAAAAAIVVIVALYDQIPCVILSILKSFVHCTLFISVALFPYFILLGKFSYRFIYIVYLINE